MVGKGKLYFVCSSKHSEKMNGWSCSRLFGVNCGQSELRGDNKFETENISSFKKRTVGHFSAIFVVNFYILIRQGICVESRLSVLHLDIKTKHRH